MIMAMSRHFEYSNYQISQIHTTTITVPSSVHRPLCASSADDNKICQWYCCSCGQSYGSIHYNHNEEKSKETSNESHNPIEQDLIGNENQYHSNININIDTPSGISTNSSVESPFLNSPTLNVQDFRYYGQMGHSNSLEPSRSESNLSGSSVTESSSPKTCNYDFYSPSLSQRHMDNENAPLTLTRSKSLGDLLEDKYEQSQTTIPGSRDPLHLHPTENDHDNYNQRSVRGCEIILNIPTRFTCHRCNHMMCPYCPKVRLRDLE